MGRIRHWLTWVASYKFSVIDLLYLPVALFAYYAITGLIEAMHKP
jgi:hypothetical protein